MVSTKEEEVLWVLNLVRQEETGTLNGVLATIHIVPQKEVICFRRKPPYLKQPQEIVVLSVNVSYMYRQTHTCTCVQYTCVSSDMHNGIYMNTDTQVAYITAHSMQQNTIQSERSLKMHTLRYTRS